jgi:predicted hydrolase (HD superfamily)
MSENTVRLEVSFRSLLEAVSSLDISEKRQLWEVLESELFDEDSPEDIAEIQQAYADYKAGDYVTLQEYAAQRAQRTV